MRIRFQQALIVYAVLAAAAVLTLQGKLRAVTLVVLAAFAVKTWIAKLKDEQLGP